MSTTAFRKMLQTRNIAAAVVVCPKTPILSKNACRSFQISAICLAGHNKWTKIKHTKMKLDSRRANQFTKIALEIIESTKAGGSDLGSNKRLQTAIDQAKKAGLPKASIDRALKRGQGISESEQPLKPLLIECLGPGGVGILIECQTDNKLRDVQDIKKILKDSGIASTVPAIYLFTRKGYVHVSPPADDTSGKDDLLNTLMEAALELPIEDVNDISDPDEDEMMFEITIPDQTQTAMVAKSLPESLPKGWEIRKSAIGYFANEDTLKKIDETAEVELQTLLEQLHENNNVMGMEIHTNVDYR